ncbi:MAG TPA: M42 family peptidase, partial [Clostridia bacterium]|nr:M42 family peptidase [Clostridia bacterium]
MDAFCAKKVEADFRRDIGPLCAVHGASGFENDCVDLVRSMLDGLDLEIEQDLLLNLVAFKRGNGKKKVLLAAHTDEIGLIIRRIDAQGWLWVENLGGLRAQQLFGKHVVIKTETGYVDGIVNCIKPGRPESCTEIPPLSDFYVEVGATSKEEALAMGLEVGNPISIDYPTLFLGPDKGMVAGKALDDRACLFMLIELAKLFENDPDIPDVYLVFSSQEEVGCRGAKVAAQRIKPDVAIAVDISIATDVPGYPDRKMINRLGDGVGIKVMDKLTGLPNGAICSQGVVREMKRIAR